MEVPAEMIAAKNLVEPALLALPGINGMGIGFPEEGGELMEDQLAVVVFVDDAAQFFPGIPQQVDGFPVVVVERRFMPCGFPDVDRYAELRGGAMIDTPLGQGTLGALVQDAHTGETLGLTCYHVSGGAGMAFPDTIWQPRRAVGFVGNPPDPADNIGGVVRVDFPMTTTPTFPPMVVGTVDAAVIELGAARQAGRTLARGIANMGSQQPNLIEAITATATANPGSPVCKRGFRTGLTHGIVGGVELSVKWWGPGAPRNGPHSGVLLQQRWVRAKGANAVFALTGDSGSVVLQSTDAGMPTATATGLLWGAEFRVVNGEETGGGTWGVMSDIGEVEQRLGISVVFA